MNESKVDAYVFMHRIEAGKTIREVIEAFAGAPGVRFVAHFVGSFIVFGAVESDDLEALQRAIEEPYWERGLRSEWSILIRESRLAIPKRGSPDYCAIVRAKTTRDPFDVLDALDDHFEEAFTGDPDHREFWYGAAVVTGDFDLLIDLGAPSMAELRRLIVDEVRAVDGVGQTQTSMAFLPDNAMRPPAASA